MPTRAEILDTLAASQTQVLAFFQGLSPQDLERPATASEVPGAAPWRAKDHLAHLVKSERNRPAIAAQCTRRRAARRYLAPAISRGHAAAGRPGRFGRADPRGGSAAGAGRRPASIKPTWTRTTTTAWRCWWRSIWRPGRTPWTSCASSPMINWQLRCPPSSVTKPPATSLPGERGMRPST